MKHSDARYPDEIAEDIARSQTPPATEELMPVVQRRLVLPSEAYPNSNYFEVTYTCRIPTTCEVDSLEARNHIERNPKTWVSYLEKVESKFVGQNVNVEARRK